MEDDKNAVAVINRDNINEKSVRLWEFPFKQGISKAILSLNLDEECDSKDYEMKRIISKNSSDQEVTKYGYDYSALVEFWNLLLTNEKVEAQDKSEQINRLKRLFGNFEKYCMPCFSKVDITKREILCFSYPSYNGRFEGIQYTKEDEEAGADRFISGIEIDDESKTKFVMKPSNLYRKNETKDYWFYYPGLFNMISVSNMAASFEEKDENRKVRALILLLEIIKTFLIKSNKTEEEAEKSLLGSIKKLEEIYKDSPSKLPYFTKEYYDERGKENGKGKRREYLKRFEKYISDADLYCYKFEIINEEVYANINTDENAFVDGVRSFYEIVKETSDKLTFCLCTEKERGMMGYFRGKRIYCNYNCAFGEELFDEFLAQRIQSKNNTSKESIKIAEIKEVVPFFEAKTVSFAELCSYQAHFPEYQREFVWGNKQFAPLFQKLTKSNQGINLGTLVFYDYDNSSGKQAYSIVDGRQRITTLSQWLWFLNDEHKEDIHPAKKWIAKQELKKEEKEALISNIKNITFSLLIISRVTPSLFQYRVFSSINGKGKKLTLEEKVKNLLLKTYPDSDKDRLKDMAAMKGFIRAFVEMHNKRHISDAELYDVFREYSVKNKNCDELFRYYDLYCILKGIAPADYLYDKEQFWLKMYQHLKVSTADSLLLRALSERKEKDSYELETILRKLDMIYFILYIDDPTGNDRKSINAKLPRLVDINPDNLLIKMNDSEESLELISDASLWTSRNPEYLWKKMEAVDLTRTMKKNITRFLLILCELWYKMPFEDAEKLMLSGKIKNCDIEHIFPANPDVLLIPEDFQRPDYLYRLQNVILLESFINRSVSNGMLIDIKKIEENSSKKKNNVYTKLGNYEDSQNVNLINGPFYADSIFSMAKMFYECSEKRQNKGVCKDFVDMHGEIKKGFYGKAQAEERIRAIRETVLVNNEKIGFAAMFNEILPPVQEKNI